MAAAPCGSSIISLGTRATPAITLVCYSLILHLQLQFQKSIESLEEHGWYASRMYRAKVRVSPDVACRVLRGSPNWAITALHQNAVSMQRTCVASWRVTPSLVPTSIQRSKSPGPSG
ncbi:hypothetical protein ARMGADRAFT_113278 [Armillaria gallica]|uniref:Uncharacterized protein n=1 Tax=Armillaria gallica TaxID=47427 RepID=A0A2H3E2U2_ARMGA|nr:hypothetical protein ARMGADRAFT_113278 [Armillaria gallica]